MYFVYVVGQMICKVQEIGKENQLKLFMFPNQETLKVLLMENLVWRVSKLFNASSLEKAQDSLVEFCTKIKMAEPLMQLLLTPPICNQNNV